MLDDDEVLGKMHDLKAGEIKKYDVYVVELMDGNINEIDASSVGVIIM